MSDIALSRRFRSRDPRALSRAGKTLSHSCKLQGGGAKEKAFHAAFNAVHFDQAVQSGNARITPVTCVQLS